MLGLTLLYDRSRCTFIYIWNQVLDQPNIFQVSISFLVTSIKSIKSNFIPQTHGSCSNTFALCSLPEQSSLNPNLNYSRICYEKISSILCIYIILVFYSSNVLPYSNVQFYAFLLKLYYWLTILSNLLQLRDIWNFRCRSYLYMYTWHFSIKSKMDFVLLMYKSRFISLLAFMGGYASWLEAS